ncbi:hypothetical protein QQX98_001595 [Neonectria punicea]|uniref:Uncharacterized protein n=1 Tax=Neonectria punicea TaxID=979145 RepID=A0ABR1HNJ3_9HYPO
MSSTQDNDQKKPLAPGKRERRAMREAGTLPATVYYEPDEDIDMNHSSSSSPKATGEDVERVADRLKETLANHSELINENDQMINYCGNSLYQLEQEFKCLEKILDDYKAEWEKKFKDVQSLAFEAIGEALAAKAASADHVANLSAETLELKQRVARLEAIVDQRMVDETIKGVDGMGL